MNRSIFFVQHASFEDTLVIKERNLNFLHKHGLHAFFISNTFISKTMLKLPKNPAKANQHPEAEHLLF